MQKIPDDVWDEFNKAIQGKTDKELKKEDILDQLNSLINLVEGDNHIGRIDNLHNNCLRCNLVDKLKIIKSEIIRQEL